MLSGGARSYRIANNSVPGSAVASVRRTAISPATSLVYSATTSPNVPLDRELLPGLDLVVQLDEKLDEPTLGGKNKVPAVRDENIRVAAGAAHWAGNDRVMLEHVHGALHEQGDHVAIENTRGADLGQ